VEGRVSFLYLPPRSFQDDKKENKTALLPGGVRGGVILIANTTIDK
jgi:hypothetical protein